ncbi:MFS transporter [Micrococcus luteus]
MTATTPEGSSTRFSPEQTRILLVLLMPLFLALMSVSVVNVAVPAIERGLGASSADLQWVLSGYTLTYGVVLVAAGRAGDLWGRKPLFLTGILVYVVGSVLSGLAVDALMLNASRLLMGCGAGLFNPQIIGVIQSSFSGRARGRAYGFFGTVIGLGVAVGPPTGGALLGVLGDQWGWRSLFLLNVPLGLAALVMGVLWLHPPTHTTADLVPKGLKYLDPVGMALLAATTVSLMLPFILPDALWLLAVAVVLVAAWWAWEVRVRATATRTGVYPMVDPALFRRPSFTLGTLQVTVYMAAMPAAFAVVALFAQDGLGLSPFVAGVSTLTSALMVVALSAWIGARVDRFGPWFVFVGGVLAVVSALLLIVAFAKVTDGSWHYWTIPLILLPQGVSQALILTSSQVLMMDDVAPREAGAAGGVSQTIQRIGTSTGIAAVTGVYFMAVADAPGLSAREASGAASVDALWAVLACWTVVLVIGAADLIRRAVQRRRGQAAAG